MGQRDGFFPYIQHPWLFLIFSIRGWMIAIAKPKKSHKVEEEQLNPSD
jgi:hypothetical protein